jgi:phosphoglycolate phosphatase
MLRSFRNLPVESIRLLVFDLDGTLIDSRQDLCNSVNATLEKFGLAPLPDDMIAGFIGDGAQLLIRRALAVTSQRRRPVVRGPVVPGEMPVEHDPEEIFDEAFLYFLNYYRAHKLDYTRLYPGVVEALDGLRTMPDGTARKMAVLTNKPVGPARAICDGLGISSYFFSVYGGDSFATKKPDPLGLVTLMTEAGCRPEETLMVGDSDVDIKAARNAGTWALGCSFGLAPETLELAEPDAIADHAAGWLTALMPQEAKI